MTKGMVRLCIACGIGLFALIVFLGSFKIVEPGHRGYRVTLGEMSQQVVDEGWNWKWPFITAIKPMDVRTTKIQRETPVYTKDIQTATILYAINYNVVPDKVPALIRNVGRDYQAKTFDQIMTGALKDVIGKWNAQELVANREKAAAEIKESLVRQVSANGYLTVTDFQILNIDYSDVFEKAIEAKVVAEQKAQEAVNRTVEIEETAKQKVISATAEAQSMEIRAQALVKNPKLAEYEAVLRWDGKLPQYMMGNTVPFINIGK